MAAVFTAMAGALLMAVPAQAQEVFGRAKPWETWLQPTATPVADRIEDFHAMLLWITTAIAVFVLILLLIVIFRFNAKANPTPNKFSHNSLLEVLWTAVPILVLVAIAIPSFKLMYYADHNEQTALTVKAIGHQWYWSYEYPDNGDFTFDSFLVDEADLKPGQPRLLTTDAAVVVPVNTNVKLLTASTDVIHSWAMPAFGIKLDAVPGRVNETWFRVEKEGTYYGQCSELCGTNHGYMPIMVKAVSKDDFAKWLKKAKEEYASADGRPVTVADAHAPRR